MALAMLPACARRMGAPTMEQKDRKNGGGSEGLRRLLTLRRDSWRFYANTVAGPSFAPLPSVNWSLSKSGLPWRSIRSLDL